MKDEINEAEGKLTEAKAQIRSVLVHVEDEDDKTILELRYLGFREWREIADIMQLHDRTVRRKQTQALLFLDTVGIEYKKLLDSEKMPGDVP